MEFIETEIFTREIQSFLDDEEYALLQIDLIRNPTGGVIIPGTRGLRKLRWFAKGKGKRGGLRIIYYFYSPRHRIYMLYPFAKSEQTDLKPEQLKLLMQDVKGAFYERS